MKGLKGADLTPSGAPVSDRLNSGVRPKRGPLAVLVEDETVTARAGALAAADEGVRRGVPAPPSLKLRRAEGALPGFLSRSETGAPDGWPMGPAGGI